MQEFNTLVFLNSPVALITWSLTSFLSLYVGHRPSTHNYLHPLARTDPIQSCSTLYPPQKPNKRQQHGPKSKNRRKFGKFLPQNKFTYYISRTRCPNLDQPSVLKSLSRSDYIAKRPIQTQL